MNVEIVNKKENVLLSRLEIEANLTFEGVVPSRDQVRENLANQLKKDSKLVIIKTIKPNYGEHNALVHAHIYEDKGTLKKLENLKKKYMVKEAEHEKAEEEAKKKAEEDKAATENATDEKDDGKQQTSKEENKEQQTNSEQAKEGSE